MNMDLYIARHGESLCNCGLSDFHDCTLTKEGFRMTELLGRRLSHLTFDAIIASPLLRAVLTAYDVAKYQPEGAKIELLPDIVEHDTPAFYITMTPEEIGRVNPDIPRFLVPCETDPSPAGGRPYLLDKETEWDMMARAYRTIAYIQRRFAGEYRRVLLVAHGTFNSRLIAAALKQGHPAQYNASQDNTALSMIRYLPSGQIKLSFCNDVSHLYEQGLVSDRYGGEKGRLF